MKNVLLPFLIFATASVFAVQTAPEPPPKPPATFFQVFTPAFDIESNVSKAYTEKVAAMVRAAEQKFYDLFKLTPDLMKGVSKLKFDNKANIPGDVLAQAGFHPYVEVRVFKDMEGFSDEWFDEIGVKDKQQRLRQGLPGAWSGYNKDYEGKKMQRKIRSYLANRDDDEMERTLLHEMGHIFMQTYLLEFAGSPPPGQEAQKRGTPAWLGEGLAQFFETHWSKAASAEKARLRQQAMIYEAAQIGDSYPFEEFMNITNAHNLAAIAGNPLKATLNYAQSQSVMDYMINTSGAAFFNFLQNLRAMNFERNLRSKEQSHVPELYSFQNEAFKKAFNCDITDVEGYWKKQIKKNMEGELKKKPELNYWIGEYYLLRGKDKQNDLVKAEEKFNLAMTLAPTKGEGYLGMGRMALRKQNGEDALKYLAKAAELMPKDEDPWYYLGMAQLNGGKAKEAIESFDRSLKIYARSHRALGGMGWACLYAGEYEKASASFELAYEASRQPLYLFQKGQASFFGKKYVDAQKSFANFCDVFPLDAQGQFWYGMAAWRLNDKEFGLKKIGEASKLNPTDPTIKEALQLAQKGESIHFTLESPESAPGATEKPKEKPKPNIQIEDE